MKKIYWDVSEREGCIGVLGKDIELIPAGVTLYPLSVRNKNAEYQKYANSYDLRFIFDDDIPQIDFYTVPRVDVFAQDSLGGLFGTIGQITDIDDVAPICYINKNKECFMLANNLRAFLQRLASECEWRTDMIPNPDILFYKSKADAEESLEFLAISQEFKNDD